MQDKIYAVIEYGGEYSDSWNSVIFTTFDEQLCIDYINDKIKEKQSISENYDKDEELWYCLHDYYRHDDAIDLYEEFYKIRGYYYEDYYDDIDYRIEEYLFIDATQDNIKNICANCTKELDNNNYPLPYIKDCIERYHNE